MSEDSPGESEETGDGHSGGESSLDVGLDPASHSDTSSVEHRRSASPSDTGSSFLRGLDPGGDETLLQAEVLPPSVLTFDPASSEYPSPTPSVADDSESVAAFLKEVIGDNDRKPSALQPGLSETLADSAVAQPVGLHGLEQGSSQQSSLFAEKTPPVARRSLLLRPRPQKGSNVASVLASSPPPSSPPPPSPKKPPGKPRGGYVCGLCKRPIKEAHKEGICPICEFCGRPKKDHPGGCPRIPLHKETQTGDPSEGRGVITVSEGVWPPPSAISDAALGPEISGATPTAASGSSPPAPSFVMGGDIRGNVFEEGKSGEMAPPSEGGDIPRSDSLLTAADQLRSDRDQIEQEQQIERSDTIYSDASSNESDDDIEVYEV